MLKRKIVSLLASLGFGIIAASAAGLASASTMSCPTNVASDVSNSVSCLILSPLNGGVNDSVSPPASSFTVNQESFFGINTWSFNGKFTPPTSSDSSLVTFTGDATSGNYNINTVAFPTYNELMFVFKDGDGTNLVAYLINISAGSGTYKTPFTDPPFDLPGNSTSHDISHVSVYYATDPRGPGTGTGIPEPGTVALLGIGLLGAVAKRARSQRA